MKTALKKAGVQFINGKKPGVRLGKPEEVGDV
jgi:hypothetical protein